MNVVSSYVINRYAITLHDDCDVTVVVLANKMLDDIVYSLSA